MTVRFIEYTKKQPARAIVIVVCSLTVFAGLFMFTPWFGPLEASPLFGGPVDTIGIYATAVINILVALPALYGVWKNNRKPIASGAFAMFLWYLFVSLSRLLLFPYPGRLLWLPALMVALVMGVVYLEKKNLLQKTAVVEKVRIGEDD